MDKGVRSRKGIGCGGEWLARLAAWPDPLMQGGRAKDRSRTSRGVLMLACRARQWMVNAGALPRRTGRRIRRLGCALVLSLVSCGPVSAEFIICNQTLNVVNAAIGQSVDNDFVTKGWWTIGANQCATVIREELTNRYVYVYASDVFSQSLLDGTVPMCVAKNRFLIRGIDDCWRRGHLEMNFLEVDTQAVERWTLFLSDR